MNPGRQFTQLDMFKPVSELMDPKQTMAADFHPAFGPAIPYAQGWAKKLREADTPTSDGPSLSVRIMHEGIKRPVEIIHGGDRQMLNDGHHRVAASAAINPDSLVPVQHTDHADQQWRRPAWVRKVLP